MKQRKWVRRSEAEWHALFARQMRSGVSVAAFCERERINAQVFRRWQARLAATGQCAETASVMHTTVQASPFIDLGELRPDRSRFEVRLELGNGMALSIARG